MAQANVVIFFIQNVITVWCYSLRDIDFWSVGARSVVEGTKGQLISKCLFAVFNERKQVNLRYHDSKVHLFCLFFGRNIGLKNHFEFF